MSFLSNGSEVFSSHFKQSNDAYLHLDPQGDRVYEYSNYSDDALSYYVQEINMSPLKENIYNANLGSYITEALIEYIETLEYQLR